MIAALLLSAAPIAGTTFDCSVSTAYLTLFAPAEEVTAGHHGNVLTLYRLSGDGEIFPVAPRLRQVVDSMPDGLYVSATTAENRSIELEFANLDMAGGTAALSLSSALPGEAPVKLDGSCRLTRSNGDQN